MRASLVFDRVIAHAADVRRAAVAAGLSPTQKRRKLLKSERQHLEDIESDAPRVALEDLLDAVDRVLDVADAGDHMALAVRTLDVMMRRAERVPRPR